MNRSCFIISLLLLGFVNYSVATIYSGACLQTCCCRVCSNPTSDGFPYGLLDVSSGTSNPTAPALVGSSCTIPTWADQGTITDLSGNTATAPDTLWWVDSLVFGTTVSQLAPTTCSCCAFSGLDTGCEETRPMSRAPTTVTVSDPNSLEEFGSTVLAIEGGIEQSVNDIVELRNDTHCGYVGYSLRSSKSSLINATGDELNATRLEWTITMLPPSGCYTVCYYHTQLTTPTWSKVGELVVRSAPGSTLTSHLDPRNIPFPGSSVTIRVSGKLPLSIFDGTVYLVSDGGTCAAGPVVLSSASSGPLDVADGFQWCSPRIAPKVSLGRPLRYLPALYSDCPSSNQLNVPTLEWKVALPSAAGNYTVCYSTSSTTETADVIAVPELYTPFAALMTLYRDTAGENWIRQDHWGVESVSTCSWFGIRCDAAGDITHIILPRNGLDGTLPAQLFTSTFASKLQYISFEDNRLSGSLPREMGALTSLMYIELGQNLLSGSIPISLQNAPLRHLYVGENSFDGSIPPDLAAIRAVWRDQTSISDAVPTASTDVICPTDEMVCSERGSTDTGVSQCGFDGIDEETCLGRNCCFNAQAALVFGGKSCFTKKRATFDIYPICQSNTLCEPQNPTTA